jgi:hypothetical protein
MALAANAARPKGRRRHVDQFPPRPVDVVGVWGEQTRA